MPNSLRLVIHTRTDNANTSWSHLIVTHRWLLRELVKIWQGLCCEAKCLRSCTAPDTAVMRWKALYSLLPGVTGVGKWKWLLMELAFISRAGTNKPDQNGVWFVRKGSMHCDSVFPGNRALLSWGTVCPQIVDQLRSVKLTLSSHHHWELWCQNTLDWVLKSSTNFCASVTWLQFRKCQVCVDCLPCAPSNLDCVFFFQYVGLTIVL